jgi:periplasmic copper chaperone A
MSKRIALLGVVGALVGAPAAAAHVTANPTAAAAGGFAMISFRVPHGCEDSPTTSLTIRIPDGVVSVTPQSVPGWEVSTTSGKLATPVELHGSTVTEGVKQVTWTGGPLDAHQFTDFGISMAVPDTPGETLYFPAVQRCEQGVTRWITIPVAGQDEPDTPAPGVELLAAAGGHGASEETEDGADEEATAAGEPEEDESNAVEYVALGLGAGGLAAGLAALGMAWRRPRRA